MIGIFKNGMNFCDTSFKCEIRGNGFAIFWWYLSAKVIRLYFRRCQPTGRLHPTHHQLAGFRVSDVDCQIVCEVNCFFYSLFRRDSFLILSRTSIEVTASVCCYLIIWRCGLFSSGGLLNHFEKIAPHPQPRGQGRVVKHSQYPPAIKKGFTL